MRINHNISALSTYNAYSATQTLLNKCMQRLSTGLRINSAADDAAGLAISEKMRTQYSGLDRAMQNTQDGISLIQTADGALGEAQSMLQRMRELSVQAANDSLTNEDRDYIQQEVDALKEAIDTIARTTSFNNRKLFDGTFNFLGSSSDLYAALVQSNATVEGEGDISGNYKITVNSKAGKAEVLKSGILYASSGTKTTKNNVIYNDQDKTNLKDVGAVNLAVGTYSLETREVPFGGTIFYENGTVVSDVNAYDNTHGVISLLAPGINDDEEKVSYGEYDFRATDTVPFMATYDLNADGTGTVASVEPPTASQNSKNAPSNGTDHGVQIDRAVNASMSFSEVTSATRHDTLLWNNVNYYNIHDSNIDNSEYSSSFTESGTVGSLLIPKADYEYNMFTTFDVTVYDRWRLGDNAGAYTADYNAYADYYTDSTNNIRYRIYGGATVTIAIDGVSFNANEDIEEIKSKLSGSSWVDEPDFVSKTSGQFEYKPTTITVSVTMTNVYVSDPSLLNSDGPPYDTSKYNDYINDHYDDVLNSVWTNARSLVDFCGFLGEDARIGSNAYQSLTNGDTTMTYTFNFDGSTSIKSDSRVARDRIQVTATYEGVDLNGNIVSDTEYQDAWRGFNKGVQFNKTYAAYTSLNYDCLMENGALLTTGPPYNPGRSENPPANLASGWRSADTPVYWFDFAMYTSPALTSGADVITAQTAIQNSNRIGYEGNRNIFNNPIDNITGDYDYAWPKIDYVFTAGELDDKEVSLPQVYRADYYYIYDSDGNTYTAIGNSRYILFHHFAINGEFETKEDAITYGFRTSSDPVSGDDYTFNYNAKAFFGKETTSYFDNAGDPEDYFDRPNIQVFAQENSNAALAFRYRGLDASGNHSFDVGVKGYDADGKEFDYEVRGASVVGGKLTLHDGTGIDGVGSVTFSKFNMNWGLLTVGDVFIVNVTAAALAVEDIKASNLADPSDSDKGKLTDFSWGTDTITTSGKPQGNAQMGATSEYRFIDGVLQQDAEGDGDGRTIEVLGYFVDPIDGADEELGIQNQGFEMTFADTGLVPPQGTKNTTLARSTAAAIAYAGSPDMNIGRTIHAEVNYVGASDPMASAVIGSYYFEQLNTEHKTTVGVTNFVRSVRYNNEQAWNGSILFDVVDISGGDIRFRVQGHLYDGDGNYRYVEEHDLWLHPGTNNNLLLFGGDAHEGLNAASQFAGLLFDTIELAADTSLFREGDRFTLSLAADAREGGGMSSWDELNLTGEGLGTGYPLTWRFREGVLDNSMTELKLFQVDSKPVSPNGTDVTRNDVLDGYFYVLAGDYHNKTQTGSWATGSDTPRSVKGAAEFVVSKAKGFDAQLAHYYTKLKDIKNFYDASGRFLLSTPQTIQIREGSDTVSVTLYGEMEVKDMVETFKEALYRLGGEYLEEKFPGGMILSGKDVVKAHSDGFHDETHLAEWFNWERRESSYETVPGTFLLRSFEAGKEGGYHFTGNSDLLNALTFMTIQEAKENQYTLFSEDAHTGKFVAQAMAWSGTVCDEIMPGDAAIKFDARFGVEEIAFNEKTGGYDFDMGDGKHEFYVHVAAQDAQLQVGANKKDTFRFNIRDMSVESLGLTDVYVTDAESAKSAVTAVDKAIGLVSYQRAKLGAYQNRLEHTINNQLTASTNMQSSEGRIRDADMTKELMAFTKLNILSQAEGSMMAQANQLPQNILNLLK